MCDLNPIQNTQIWLNKIEHYEANPKCFWSFIKAKRTDHCGVVSLNHDGSVHSDSVAKSNILSS